MLNAEDIKRLAHLVRLELSEKKEEQFAGQLSRILEYIATLQSVDTTGVDLWTEGVAAGTGATRPDEVKPFAYPETLRPSLRGAFVRVRQKP